MLPYNPGLATRREPSLLPSDEPEERRGLNHILTTFGTQTCSPKHTGRTVVTTGLVSSASVDAADMSMLV